MCSQCYTHLANMVFLKKYVFSNYLISLSDDEDHKKEIYLSKSKGDHGTTK